MPQSAVRAARATGHAILSSDGSVISAQGLDD
jgi:hypothetical protein